MRLDDETVCTACRMGVCSVHQPSQPCSQHRPAPRSDDLSLTEAFSAAPPRLPRMTHEERDAKLQDVERRLERLAETIDAAPLKEPPSDPGEACSSTAGFVRIDPETP